MSGGRQSRKRELAIANLLVSATLEQAAQRTRVSEKTLRLWLAEPEFSRAFRNARRLVLEQSINVLQQSSLAAAATMIRAMHCGKASVELNAADKILERAVQGIELFDLIGRVEQLEERLAQQGVGHENRSTFPN